MKTITLCGSIKFFGDMIELREQLEKIGLSVNLPYGAEEFVKQNDLTETYNTEDKNWYIHEHFKRITSGDAILVVNNKKNEIDNYIGGNVLMEIALALNSQKDIFILNDIPEVSFKDEVEGSLPIILKGDVTKIRDYYDSLPEVYVASESAIKIRGVSQGLRMAGFRSNVIGFTTKSDVSEQPLGFNETLRGVKNRLTNLVQTHGNADLFVAIEAGIIELSSDEHHDFNLVLVSDRSGKEVLGISSSFKVKENMYKNIKNSGLELGPIFIEKYGASEKDPFAIATNGSVKREDVIAQALSTAYSRLVSGI